MAKGRLKDAAGEAVEEVAYEDMPLDELVALRDTLNTLIGNKADAQRAALREQLAALDALAGRPKAAEKADEPARTRNSPAAKYRSKKDSSVTWSGRGATAGWLKKEMAETGEPIEAFLIS